MVDDSSMELLPCVVRLVREGDMERARLVSSIESLLWKNPAVKLLLFVEVVVEDDEGGSVSDVAAEAGEEDCCGCFVGACSFFKPILISSLSSFSCGSS